jgi:hypothetical protein
LAQRRAIVYVSEGEPGYINQDDTIEAYYPAGHVELYWLIWGPTFVDPIPQVPAGWELEPEPEVPVRPPGTNPSQRYGSWGVPEPARSFVYPRYLETWGLGIISRRLEMAPCPIQPEPFDKWCVKWSYTGYLYREPDRWWEPPRAEEYFGFRLRREDGWHLGWLRLRWVWEEGEPNPDPVELVAWAVHPEPEAPLVVGEPPRPWLLCVGGAEGGLVVRWSGVWTNAVLERTVSLSAPEWTAVSGVQPEGVRLTAAEAQGFFRLRVP